MKRCWFCLEGVTLDDPETYRQVTSWVNGPKLDGPVLREQSGLVAHKKCVDNLIAGQAPDQPELFDDGDYSPGIEDASLVPDAVADRYGVKKEFGHNQEGGECAPESCGGTRYDPCTYTKAELDGFRLMQIQAHVFEAAEGSSGMACTKMVEIDTFGEDCGYPADHSIHIKEASDGE